MFLDEAKVGQKLRVVGFSDAASEDVCDITRVVELGLLPGKVVSLCYTGPIGRDPLAFEIDGGLIGIAKKECRYIFVEEV